MGLDQENAHQWTEQVLTSIVIFHHQRVIWCKLKIYAVGGPSDLIGVYTGYHARTSAQTGKVKIDQHKFYHLK